MVLCLSCKKYVTQWRPIGLYSPMYYRTVLFYLLIVNCVSWLSFCSWTLLYSYYAAKLCARLALVSPFLRIGVSYFCSKLLGLLAVDDNQPFWFSVPDIPAHLLQEKERGQSAQGHAVLRGGMCSLIFLCCQMQLVVLNWNGSMAFNIYLRFIGLFYFINTAVVISVGRLVLL